MNYSLIKKRGLNSHIEYNGNFCDKMFHIDIKWFIKDRLFLSRLIKFNIIDNKIQWINCPSISEDIQEYFNKILKLIAFG